MTWTEIFLIITLIAVAVILTHDGYIIRKQKQHNALQAAEILRLERYLAKHHPSDRGYLSVDETLMAMSLCLTCSGLRHANHFVYHPTHVEL